MKQFETCNYCSKWWCVDKAIVLAYFAIYQCEFVSGLFEWYSIYRAICIEIANNEITCIPYIHSIQYARMCWYGGWQEGGRTRFSYLRNFRWIHLGVWWWSNYGDRFTHIALIYLCMYLVNTLRWCRLPLPPHATTYMHCHSHYGVVVYLCVLCRASVCVYYVCVWVCGGGNSLIETINGLGLCKVGTPHPADPACCTPHRSVWEI